MWRSSMCRSRESDEEQLFRAAEAGDLNTVQYCLQKGTNPNATDNYNQTPLLWASANGHEAVVQVLLLDKVVDVDAKDAAGQTPLFMACENKHAAVVKCLLKHGANANAPTTRSDESRHSSYSHAPTTTPETLLHLICTPGHRPPELWLTKEVIEKDCGCLCAGGSIRVERVLTRKAESERKNTNEAIASLLLEHGANANAVDDHGKTPLHRACCGRNSEGVVKLLLGNGAKVNAKDAYGATPLSISISKRIDANVRLLLESGADVNVEVGDAQQTPLHLAILTARKDTLQMLLDHGADVDAQDKNGKTPYQFATSSNLSSLYQENMLLLEPFAKYDSRAQLELKINHLQELVRAAKDSLDPKVIAVGVDANQQLERLIPLCQSPRFPSADDLHEQIRKLEDKIANLADLEAKLRQSIKLEKLKEKLTREMDALKKLDNLGCPANDSIVHGDGKELFLAAETGTLESVVYYLSKGTDPNQQNSQGRTVLSLASENGHEAVVRLLLDYGADIDAKDTADGGTPLHAASLNGREAMVTLLLHNGANLESRNDDYKTPRQLAQANDFEACAAAFEPFDKFRSRAALDREIQRLQGVLDSHENFNTPSVIADATRQLERLLALCQCKRFSTIDELKEQMKKLKSKVAQVQSLVQNEEWGY